MELQWRKNCVAKQVLLYEMKWNEKKATAQRLSLNHISHLSRVHVCLCVCVQSRPDRFLSVWDANLYIICNCTHRIWNRRHRIIYILHYYSTYICAMCNSTRTHKLKSRARTPVPVTCLRLLIVQRSPTVFVLALFLSLSNLRFLCVGAYVHLALHLSLSFCFHSLFSVIADESYIHLWFYAACHYLWMAGVLCAVCVLCCVVSCRWIKFWWTCYYLLTSVNVQTSRRRNVTWRERVHVRKQRSANSEKQFGFNVILMQSQPNKNWFKKPLHFRY